LFVFVSRGRRIAPTEISPFNVNITRVGQEINLLENGENYIMRSIMPNIVRVIKSRIMRWPGHVARMGEGRGMYRVLVGKPEGKRLLGRPSRRWEDNIKVDLLQVGCGGMDWIELAQGRDRLRALVIAAMNLWVP
jgi:hypothetical protein